MPEAHSSAALAADADTVWREIGTFQGVGWHPWLRVVEGYGEEPGAQRTATTADGQQQVERLEGVERERRRYRYTLTSTPLPVRDYLAELSVAPAGDGCTVEWSAEFTVTPGVDHDEAVGSVRSFLGAGIEHLVERYGRL